MSLPQRGEVWLADFGMAGKVRPVVVVSVPFADSDRALITVVPHTTSLVGSVHEVRFQLRWLQPGAFNIQAVGPLPPPKFIRLLGTLTQGQMSQVEVALKQWEGLT
jgi:mRNA interferase MazF